MNEKPIMLVEDNPDDEFLALLTLRKNGMENVVVARDGVDAINLLTDTEKNGGLLPLFILLDLKLPKISGIDVLRAIRAKERTRDVPVIVLSSSKEDCDVATCCALGVKYYLTKPLKTQELNIIMEELHLYPGSE